MRFNVATVALAAAPLAAAQNYMNKYPLSNGFPNPSPAAIAEIEKNAGGYLPNTALPTTLSDTATAAFQLLGLNEIFEVAYFSSLLTNITQNKPGYTAPNSKYLQRSFFRIRAQEEIHALAVNAVLKAAGKPTVTGCKYTFPATNLAQGIHVANLFTDVVLGALAQVQGLLTENSEEAALIPILGSILAQEGEQVGYFRYFQDLVPSAAPLLTGTPAPFAYSALSMFLVPGSCNLYPNIPKLPLLTVVTTPQPQTMDLIYTVEGTVDANSETVTYLSGGGRNPVTVPIKNVSTSNGKTQFAASFPYDSGFANGLTLAAVTKGKGPFSSPSAVAAAAAYGPGLIEVQ